MLSTPSDSANNLADNPSSPHGGVGLSDPSYSQSRRKMLDLINRLHGTGVQKDIDLPVIAVIGQQSAGKSSLIESMSGITLPRASGTCTRCPTECRLSYSTQPWKCLVYLQHITDERGQTLGQARKEPFGEAIFDKAEVEERIRRAQRAILNPSRDARHFLTGQDEDPSVPDLSFSMSYVSLHISSSDVEDLSFVDLPGLIASVGEGGNSGDIDLVKRLVTTYISKPSCIILLTVACETDFENQAAHHLAKVHDPSGKRTIGVLTKPDRIPPGEEDRWLRFIKNEYEPLDNGWFSVKQPDSRALSAGISWADARRQEQEYFLATSPWSDLDSGYQRFLGTARLTECLSAVLSDLIAKRLPKLQDELQELLQKTENDIRSLPKPPSADPFAEILYMLSQFSRDLSKHLEGIPSKDGLLQAIKPEQQKFKKAIRDTAPVFVPYTLRNQVNTDIPDYQHKNGKEAEEDLLYNDSSIAPASMPYTLRNQADADFTDHQPVNEEQAEEDLVYDDSSTALPSPDFLAHEEDTSGTFVGKNEIYINQVMDQAEMAIARELPGHYPFVVCITYINSFTSKWRTPTQNLFDSIKRILTIYVKGLTKKHFDKFSHGGLLNNVTIVVADYIESCCKTANSRVLWLLELEKSPSTLNTHYHMNYKDNFLAYYRGHRQSDTSGHLTSKLKRYNAYCTVTKGETKPKSTAFDQSVSKVLSGLSELGINGAKPTDLYKLLPSDPYEPALDIMATVRAYFQVAYKRFVDNVSMAIDYELVLGLNRDGALENALREGLGIIGPDGHRRSREYLQEHRDVVTRRQELEKRRERLDKAKTELMDLF
ncbi:hypothetical protein AcW1_007088 [Taiwanofungus camphoratus]|nr:hypothetical protein AcW2_005899 [Antrodia cinnamomea]KAI0955534.1 hypothetical protein AcW1_007088 [Antrodia cinnamomea]